MSHLSSRALFLSLIVSEDVAEVDKIFIHQSVHVQLWY
jgi:hypothetical protein